MINYDANLEKRKKDFEKGLISSLELTSEEKEKLKEIYINEIESNNKEILSIKGKIKTIKKEIDNLV